MLSSDGRGSLHRSRIACRTTLMSVSDFKAHLREDLPTNVQVNVQHRMCVSRTFNFLFAAHWFHPR
jgi:hypothetical protein